MNNNNWKYKFFGGTDLDGKRLAWSGVIAGLFTFTAVFLTLSLIGFSIGLTTFNPLSENPLNNVGTNVTIWTIVALIISFSAGGFISGLVANKAGFLHGFMTWVVGVVIIAFLVTNTIGGVLKGTGTIISEAASGITKGSTKIVTKSGDALHEAIENASNEILNIDTNKLEDEITKVLKDTEVKELQPGYLEKQLEDSKNEIAASAKNILLNPDSFKSEIEALGSSLESKMESITDSIDKDTISNAVSKNTELTKEEADIAVENIYNEYTIATEKAYESIEQAKEEIDKLSVEAEELKEDIKETADDVADTGSKSALYLFLGLLIAMIITGYAGIKGAEFLI